MTTETKDQPKTREFPRKALHKTYSEPEPILDPTCIQEQMDRGEGIGTDDHPTYHRTER
jgi:hypothetical protein